MGLAWIISGPAANDHDATEPRGRCNRRTMTWRTVAAGFLRSRRRELRRCDESDRLFLDWHHPWLFFLAVGVMLFSVADAFLTLNLLALGAIEINPAMRALIELGTGGFVAAKLVLTAVGLLALIYTSRYRLFGKVRVGLFVTAFFCIYSVLIFHELLGLIALTDI